MTRFDEGPTMDKAQMMAAKVAYGKRYGQWPMTREVIRVGNLEIVSTKGQTK